MEVLERYKNRLPIVFALIFLLWHSIALPQKLEKLEQPSDLQLKGSLLKVHPSSKYSSLLLESTLDMVSDPDPEQRLSVKKFEPQFNERPDPLKFRYEELDRDYKKNCANPSQACADAGELLNGLGKGIEDAPSCDKAALAYLEYYDESFNWTPPDEIIRKYDIACLGSLITRLDGAKEINALPPEILYEGGLVGGAQGMINAVGILEIDNKPVCGGLLKNNHTFITAAHCYFDFKSQSDQGRATVRPLTGDRKPWRVMLPEPRDAGVYSGKVENDWIIFNIKTSDEISATETVLVGGRSGSVSLIGYYDGYTKIEYSNGKDQPNFKKSIRFPLQGLCSVLAVTKSCVHLSCQTVPGFSGTPIFSSKTEVGKPLSVIGFLSQEKTIESGCRTKYSSGTFAVSSLMVN